MSAKNTAEEEMELVQILVTSYMDEGLIKSSKHLAQLLHAARKDERAKVIRECIDAVSRIRLFLGTSPVDYASLVRQEIIPALTRLAEEK